MRHGLAYGVRATRRRWKATVLPVITVATGAFLVVVVLALGGAVQSEARQLGNGAELRRAVVLIAVIVLLVGAVEVAVCATRTVVSRTREIGVLGATGVPPTAVVAALLVEPVVTAAVGGLLGAAVALLSVTGLSASGATSTRVSPDGAVLGTVLAVFVSAVVALIASALPSWRAAVRPPVRSLSEGD